MKTRKLIVDIGNTRVKIAVFEGKILAGVEAFPVSDFEPVRQALQRVLPVQASVLSAVRDYPSDLLGILADTFCLILPDSRVHLPLEVDYSSPDTLGMDRLAAACGARFLYPDKDVLVVNAGTCITYEWIEKAGKYLGGSISPGMNMRFQALHTFTGRLPLLSPAGNADIPGRDTESSIRNGAVSGALFEVQGMVQQFLARYPLGVAVLGGGDAVFFANRLKSDIFVHENIVLYGLNEILDDNV